MPIIRKKLSNYLLLYLKSRLERVNDIAPSVNYSSDSWISGCDIKGDVTIARGCKLYKSQLSGKITIDRFTSLWGPGILLSGQKNGISIGSFCSIARYSAMYETFHNPQRTTTYFFEKNLLGVPASDSAQISAGPIRIGNDVWVGDGSLVLSGVSIGDGAIVAAGAVVTRDVPPFAIVAGNPARVVRYRFSPDKIQEILELKWWHWSEERLRGEVAFLAKIQDRPK